MASFTGSSIKNVYKDILHTSNSNTGISTSIKQITCGDGDATSLYLSTQNAKVQPASDSTTNTVIYDADGNALFTVDSSNDLVKAGIGQHTVNTQYATFGMTSTYASMSANTHYSIASTLTISNTTPLAIGTGTDPDTSLTVSTTAHEVIGCYWFVPDNITIDKVVWLSAADTATGDTTRAHLMEYDIDTGNGSTGGDLSNGRVVYEGSDIVNAGYEQSYYQEMSLKSGESANVNAGKVILFTFRSDSVNSDYSINATVKYHLR